MKEKQTPTFVSLRKEDFMFWYNDPLDEDQKSNINLIFSYKDENEYLIELQIIKHNDPEVEDSLFVDFVSVDFVIDEIDGQVKFDNKDIFYELPELKKIYTTDDSALVRIR